MISIVGPVRRWIVLIEFAGQPTAIEGFLSLDEAEEHVADLASLNIKARALPVYAAYDVLVSRQAEAQAGNRATP